MTNIHALLQEATHTFSPHNLAKRIKIPVNQYSPPGLIAASTQDPWSKSGKYALGWTYFSVLLFVLTCALYWYRFWVDRVARATHKEVIIQKALSPYSTPDDDYEMGSVRTNSSTKKFFPTRIWEMPAETGPTPPEHDGPVSLTWGPFNKAVALVRFVMYRPIPAIRYWKGRYLTFPGPGAACIIFAALTFVALYTFLPKPLYYASIAFGSPPVAIRAGMIAVAMMPWVVATAMKANIISWTTGIGPERLNVLHRWGSYIMLFLSLVHTVPFYITPVWDQSALQTFKNLFTGYYIYGTGLASLVPLAVLCVHSLPFLRSWCYELFVALHIPISIVYLGMLFWHCHNYLTSWNYLWATVAIWAFSWLSRLFFLNWANPWKISWLIGEECALSILPENAVKVTIPTQREWRPGQYVYLRMPGISVFENHPFTIASLCSEDFPSEYGEQYRDMTLVFRPYGGFTRKVLNTAIAKGPEQTYRAFIDGPYGGMRRDLASFETIVFFAGGSGITAIVSHLLNLIKKMREDKAVTRHIHIVWALKRPDIMDWFKEELRICREHAPLNSVHCQFYITAAKRLTVADTRIPPSPNRPFHDALHKQIDQTFQGIASKRSSAIIQEAADGDVEKEKQLRAENEDSITGLPHRTFLPAPKQVHVKNKPSLTVATHLTPPDNPLLASGAGPNGGEANGLGGFDFGFPSTPTMLQKNIMRFAFLPTMNRKKSSWSTEYGRPDIPYMLKEMEREVFSSKTCVFVCGPPSMRVDVQRVVASMQRTVWAKNREELYLHTENYAI